MLAGQEVLIRFQYVQEIRLDSRDWSTSHWIIISDASLWFLFIAIHELLLTPLVRNLTRILLKTKQFQPVTSKLYILRSQDMR